MTFIIVLIVLLSSRLEGVNLFNKIGNVEQFPFLVDEDILEVGLILKYGDKTLFNKFETMPDEMIAKLIVVQFKNKWNDLFEALQSDFDLMSGSVQVVDEKGNHEQKRDYTHELINKVGAFNSDDLLIDSGNNEINSDDVKGTNDKLTKISYNALNNLWDNLEKVSKNNIVDVVLFDIQSFLTLNIYKD